MKTEKQKIIEYAEKLYCQYDSEGSKKYSLREIETKIQQKFNKQINYSTVKTWADKFSWDAVNQKAKLHSIEKAKSEKFTIEEKIAEAASDDLALIYKGAMTLFKASMNVFKEKFDNKQITSGDALKGMQIARDTILRIAEVKDPSAANIKLNSITLTDETISEIVNKLNENY